ncbi:MAG: hypothetical protein LBU58_02150, partial [Clostridiales bacterium]|nr:hypothetical protein [Clostridiales bacterium]
PSAASAFSLEFASADSPFVSGTADPVLPAAPELELTVAEPVPSEPAFDVAAPEPELAAPEPSVASEAESVPESVSAAAPAVSLEFASAAVPVSEYAAAPAFSLESASLVDSVLALAPDLAPAPAPAPDTAPERTVSAELVVNGAMTTVCANTSELLFLDVFNHIEIDRSNPNGHLRLMLNGAPANLTDRIKTGDQVEIAWTRD